ncbi:DUF4124 domain-containing protein [Frateuria terrea]|uniref:DUF4124 domain-containing protein n=1 Tax=Frateuria terrea TaxID=529704 RepID=A0A1H6T772_9GAMM|nr:DUF4124 domain-containing protein [Frateuria terrea]SEI74004.1 hypothetical protein SAMN04487997_1647 [Frateuria terrea]SFP30114.1 hypothetical protein SAMN02927913_1562 [Frateuria terrea]
MRKLVYAVAISLAAVLTAHAQKATGIRYHWRDAKGLSHYSDSLTSGAMKYGYDLVNDRGYVVRHVERQLSPEERAAAEKVAAEQAAQRRAEEASRRADLQMLNAYGDEADLKQAQQEELDSLDQQINTTRLNLRSQEKTLADLLGRAADVERTKEKVPKYLADSIADQRNVVAGQRAVLERQQDHRDTAEKEAAQQLERYRALKKQQDEPQH